jgi:hypothetical protein
VTCFLDARDGLVHPVAGRVAGASCGASCGGLCGGASYGTGWSRLYSYGLWHPGEQDPPASLGLKLIGICHPP